MASGTELQPQTGTGLTALAPQPMWERRGFCEIFLACVSFLVFVPTLRFGFVYDDRGQVLDNPFIQSWRFFAHDFTSQVWAQTTNHAILYYRPVFLSWLRLNYSVFGTRAWGWHLTTVLAHVVVTVLVFRLALRMLGNRWQAVVAGLVFAVHPVHVENVAWVSGVVDPLLAIFFIASLMCFFKWRERRSAGWMAGSLVFGFLAMLAKEPGVVLPAVAFIYAWIVEDPAEATGGWSGRRLRASVFQSLPFALIALVYLTLRHAALKTPPVVFASNATVLLTLPGLLLFYLRLVVWPAGLTVFYDRQYLQQATFRGFVLPLLVLALIAVLLALVLRRKPQSREAVFSLAFALLTLGPVQWVRWFPGDDFVHDRYLYLPLAGFAMLFAIGVARLEGRAAAGWIVPRRQVVVAGAAAVALAIGSATLETCWASDLLLWYHCYKIAPHNQRVLNNLASSLGERGEYQSAVPLFEEVLRLSPNNADAQGNLGYTYYRMGALQPAEECLSRSVQLDPSNSHSLLYLGMTHYKLGALALAEDELRRATVLDPSAKGAHLALSAVLEQRGDLAGAILETETELSYYPNEEAVRARLKQLRGW